MLDRLLACTFSAFVAASALAQAPLPEPNDAARALVGVWELSNPDRDRRCQITFRLDPVPPGRALTFSSSCAAAFPDLRATAAWQLARDDSLRLVDKQGTVLLELNEVEAGMYETTPSHTHYFLQTLAAINKERITDDLFGEWQFTRGTARVICQMTLGNTAYDTDSFVLTLKPGCDPLITRFAPVSWRLDRGQFVMLSSAGQSWRFEESEATWNRIPAMRPPLQMVRPQ
jgi:Protease inhibitor Inh